MHGVSPIVSSTLSNSRPRPLVVLTCRLAHRHPPGSCSDPINWSADCTVETTVTGEQRVLAANPFHLGWFLGNSYGVHGWNQQWGGAGGEDWTQPDLHIELAKAVDRACFDFLLLEELAVRPDNYGSSMDFYLERARCGRRRTTRCRWSR